MSSGRGLVLVGWTLFGLATGASNSILRLTFDRPQDFWALISPLVSAWVWAGLTPLAAYSVRRFPLRGERQLLGVLILVASAPLLVIAHEALFQSIMVILKLQSLDPAQHWYSLRENLRTNFLSLFIVAWGLLAVLHAAAFSKDESSAMIEAARLEAEITEATLAAARAEVDPAFLLGTLDALGPLILRDGRTAEEVVVRLGDLLRSSYQPEGSCAVAREDIARSIDRLLRAPPNPVDS